jgi:hypothetical protein
MRPFEDEAGITWVASVKEREDDDYKGRFFLLVTREGPAGLIELPLEDVRWNSRRTAERTLKTMSETELRRRLRYAVGRAS